jgi:hypothetical protein
MYTYSPLNAIPIPIYFRESSALKNSRTSSFSRVFQPENAASLLLKKKSATQLTCSLTATTTPKSSIASSWAVNGGGESPEQRRNYPHELTPNGQAKKRKEGINNQ